MVLLLNYLTSNMITCTKNQIGNKEYLSQTTARSKLVWKICVFTTFLFPSPAVQYIYIYIYIYLNLKPQKFEMCVD